MGGNHSIPEGFHVFMTLVNDPSIPEGFHVFMTLVNGPRIFLTLEYPGLGYLNFLY